MEFVVFPYAYFKDILKKITQGKVYIIFLILRAFNFFNLKKIKVAYLQRNVS